MARLTPKKPTGPLRHFGEAFAGIRSQDAATRWMSFFFILTFFGTVGTFFYGTHYALNRWKAPKTEQTDEGNDQAKNLGKFFSKQKEVAFYKYSVLDLGKFTAELKAAP